MRVLKPEWVGNDERPIFSIDIHPDGSRFATGGQGDNCGKVVIWNMAPIRDEKEEKNEQVPKLLCQLEAHLSCVNCVKWSNNGKYLASGSDDKLIMIWQTSRYGGVSTVFGSSGKTVNVEQWRCAATLRGHSGDILDLAWSPNDMMLASCSIDNSVMIWNGQKFSEVLAILKGHTSLVKGVCWDPVGKYVASQSDDKTLRIWRTHDWGQDACITEPFKTTSGTTHILRLHWSPDGQYLVSAHAMNNSGPSAQIVERDGWKASRDFVGHRKAITVARFNPFILTKTVTKASGKEKSEKVTCCAIGSRDRSLSVWLTCLKRPLIVLHDLFTNSVLDISWGSCGTELMACSWDGTIAYLKFDKEEIGNPFSAVDMSHFYQTVYGKSLSAIGMNGFHNGMANGKDPNAIVEDPEILRLQKQQKEKAKEAAALAAINETSTNSNGAFSSPKGPTNKQIETRTQDGRRRITPLFLAPQPDLADTPLPFNSSNLVSSSTKDTSKIVVEKQDGSDSSSAATKPNGDGKPVTSIAAAFKENEKASLGTPQHNGANSGEHDKQEGSPSSASSLSPPTPKPHDEVPPKNGNQEKSDSKISVKQKLDEPTTVTPILNGQHKSHPTPAGQGQQPTPVTTPITDTPVNKSLSLKRRNDCGGASSAGIPDKKKHKKDAMSRFNHPTGTTTEGFAQPSLTPSTNSTTTPITITSTLKPASSLALTAAPSLRPTSTATNVLNGVYQPQQSLRVTRSETAALHLPNPEPVKASSFTLNLPRVVVPGASSTSSQTSLVFVEMENHVQVGRSHMLHRVRFTISPEDKEAKSSGSNPGTTWEQFFERPVLLVDASSDVTCVTCDDTSLHLFASATGTRLFPAIIVGSKASVLRVAAHFVMVLTVSAKLFLWSSKPMASIVKNAALNPIMRGHDTISLEGTLLTSEGVPMLTISSGKSYTFSSAVGSWILISSGMEDPLSQLSDHASSSHHPITATPIAAQNCKGNEMRRPLAKAQRAMKTRPSGAARHMFTSSAKSLAGTHHSVVATVSHLENQVQSALALRSGEEYKFWLGTYIRYLAKENIQEKIRETFDFLMGPMPCGSFKNGEGESNQEWEPEILGLSKHNLLDELLPTVGSHLSMQRLYTEYKEHLLHLTSGRSQRESLFSKRN